MSLIRRFISRVSGATKLQHQLDLAYSKQAELQGSLEQELAHARELVEQVAVLKSTLHATQGELNREVARRRDARLHIDNLAHGLQELLSDDYSLGQRLRQAFLAEGLSPTDNAPGDH